MTSRYADVAATSSDGASSESRPGLRFQILGPLNVTYAGRSISLRGPRERALLGLLVTAPGRVFSVSTIVDGLWDEPPDGADRTVRQYVSRLRRQMPAEAGEVIVTQPPGYLVAADPDAVDAQCFRRLAERGRRELARNDPATAAVTLAEALQLWRGEAFGEFTRAPFAAGERTGLEELRLAVTEDRIDADLTCGAGAALVADLETLVAKHPLRERLWGQLMVALYRAGRQGDALAAFRRAQAILAHELGVEPGPPLRAIEEQILAHNPALQAVPKPSPEPEIESTDAVGSLVHTRATPLSFLLPAAFRFTPAYPFVGRTDELATLTSLLPVAATDQRRIALIGGEAGSGKSRLVRELAHSAAASGVLVLYGACDAMVRSPYAPFGEVLAHYCQITEPTELRTDLGMTGPELTRLLPELASYVGEPSQPGDTDPETGRHRLHVAFTGLLANASTHYPLLLIIEDVHWADTGTLLLLRHLGRAAGGMRALVIATFRDTDADVPAELADALADLRRADDVARLHLQGLTEGEVNEFVVAAAGVPLEQAPLGLAHGLRTLTAGNPFLLCELWRSLVETETLTTSDGIVRLTRALESVDTPPGIREVVGQRLVRLPRATRSLLDLAAVAGQEFSLDTLLRAAARSVTRPESIEPAVHSGLVEETFAPALAYRFTHELVRRAIYDRQSTTRRARLHQRIGETLAAAHPEPSVRVLADLAHHFTAAAPLGGRGRAVDYNVLAAAAATAALAFDEAAALLETALDLTEPDGRQRADVLFELGMARLRAGKAAGALEAFRSAANLARRLGNSELHVRAAIAFGRAAARRAPAVDPREAIELLTEASQALGLDDSPLRVRLLGALARALSMQGDHVDAIAVRTKAIEMAHRIDDRRGLSEALLHASWTAGELSREELANAAGESRRLASEIGDLEIEVEAALLHVSALLALGDTGAARTQLAAAVDMARHARQPFLLLVAQEHVSAVALLEGRLTDAEAAAERSHAWGRQLTSGHSSHSADYGIQMFGIRREQDRLAELAPIAQLLASDGWGDGVWQPARAALFAELDMTGAVERELWEISRTGLRPLRTPLWVASLTYLADACSAVAHRDVAALVYPQLEHLSGYPIMVGYSVACYGAADRYLGMLAAVLGDTDQAERHFAAAADLNRRMGAATWLARTLYEHGRMLIGGGEMDRADGLLVEALELADRTELPAVLRRLRSLGESADGAHLPSLREHLALGVQFGMTKSAGSEG